MRQTRQSTLKKPGQKKSKARPEQISQLSQLTFASQDPSGIQNVLVRESVVRETTEVKKKTRATSKLKQSQAQKGVVSKSKKEVKAKVTKRGKVSPAASPATAAPAKVAPVKAPRTNPTRKCTTSQIRETSTPRRCGDQKLATSTFLSTILPASIPIVPSSAGVAPPESSTKRKTRRKVRAETAIPEEEPQAAPIGSLNEFSFGKEQPAAPKKITKKREAKGSRKVAESSNFEQPSQANGQQDLRSVIIESQDAPPPPPAKKPRNKKTEVLTQNLQIDSLSDLFAQQPLPPTLSQLREVEARQSQAGAVSIQEEEAQLPFGAFPEDVQAYAQAYQKIEKPDRSQGESLAEKQDQQTAKIDELNTTMNAFISNFQVLNLQLGKLLNPVPASAASPAPAAAPATGEDQNPGTSKPADKPQEPPSIMQKITEAINNYMPSDSSREAFKNWKPSRAEEEEVASMMASFDEIAALRKEVMETLKAI